MYHQISRNKRNSVFVIVGFLAVWLVAGLIIGWLAYGQGGAVAGAIVLGLLGVGAALYAYYFGSATVLAAMGAQPADPQQYQQLHNIVQALAIGDGLPLPKVYVINDPSPNAFATGRDPNHASVTVTTGLLQVLNREELEGVLAHEMSHIKNFDVWLRSSRALSGTASAGCACEATVPLSFSPSESSSPSSRSWSGRSCSSRSP